MAAIKVKGMIIVVIMMLCIPINAQAQSDKVLDCLFFGNRNQRRKQLS